MRKFMKVSEDDQYLVRLSLKICSHCYVVKETFVLLVKL